MNSTVPRGIYKARKTGPNTTFGAGGQEFPRSSAQRRLVAVAIKPVAASL